MSRYEDRTYSFYFFLLIRNCRDTYEDTLSRVLLELRRHVRRNSELQQRKNDENVVPGVASGELRDATLRHGAQVLSYERFNLSAVTRTDSPCQSFRRLQ